MEFSRPPLVVAFGLSEKRKAIVADALAGATDVVCLTELDEAARADALRNAGVLLTFNTSKELRSGEAALLDGARLDIIAANHHAAECHEFADGAPRSYRPRSRWCRRRGRTFRKASHQDPRESSPGLPSCRLPQRRQQARRLRPWRYPARCLVWR